MSTSLTSRERLITLLKKLSVKRGSFTLASGKKSDLYVDVRQTSLNALGATLIAELVIAALPEEVVGIGGMTMGADPIACSVAAVSDDSLRPIHAFLIRKKAKAHGAGLPVEGMANFLPGAKVTVVEDTTTTGGSLLKAIKAAEHAGLNVVQILTIVDRQEGAAEMLALEGYTLEALVNRGDLIE